MPERIRKVVIPEYQSGRFPQIGRFNTKEKGKKAERYIFHHEHRRPGLRILIGPDLENGGKFGREF